uniref:MADS transcription factor PI1 n=1 Tax=Staphisagria picta TaxID=984882 RepID=A0A977XR72_9MAGN|nr:MADS transcription factor PI1 [Staphisagria picta]
MGRGKIEIKRIENSTNRQVTYSKRRNGILKKAKEITVLCDAEVSLVIFSSTGKMSEFISPSSSLIKILDRYQRTSGRRLWDAKHEYLNSEVERIKKENDSMQIELRHLKGEDLTSLNPKELIPIEDALQNGLTEVRAKQAEVWKMMKKNVCTCQHSPNIFLSLFLMLMIIYQDRMLEEENKHLNYILQHQKQQQMQMNGNARDMENEYNQNGRDYPSQMPFTFRAQPMQPNLQENQ